MSQASVVTRLAVRELWITFRMLGVLVAFVGAGAGVALLAAPPVVSLQRVAVGLAIATVVTASLAAWSIADERTSGRTAWLVTRSVSRGTYLLGWFAALAGVALLGLVAAAALAWMTAAATAPGFDAADFAAAVLAIAATVTAAVALGLAAGSVARPWFAAATAAGACVLAGAAVVALPDLAPNLPGAAYLALPRMLGPDPIVGAALRATGIGLTATALLLVAARAAMERADL